MPLSAVPARTGNGAEASRSTVARLSSATVRASSFSDHYVPRAALDQRRHARLALPIIVSISQCPTWLRFSTATGRSEIGRFPAILALVSWHGTRYNTCRDTRLR